MEPFGCLQYMITLNIQLFINHDPCFTNTHQLVCPWLYRHPKLLFYLHNVSTINLNCSEERKREVAEILVTGNLGICFLTGGSTELRLKLVLPQVDTVPASPLGLH